MPEFEGLDLERLRGRAKEIVKLLGLGNAERKLLAERMVFDSRKAAEFSVNVFGAHANAVVDIRGTARRTDLPTGPIVAPQPGCLRMLPLLPFHMS